MHWEAQYPEPKKPKRPRPFDNYDAVTCVGFAYAYMFAIMSFNIFAFVMIELLWGTFVYVRINEK